MTEAERERLEKLEAFFKQVGTLTVNHDVIDDYAVVFPKHLGEALEHVDPLWWENL